VEEDDVVSGQRQFLCELSDLTAIRIGFQVSSTGTLDDWSPQRESPLKNERALKVTMKAFQIVGCEVELIYVKVVA
jgi:hypothetical protein